MSKKIYSGEVISDTMNKTVVVAVKRLFQHPRYKKTVKRVTKFKAHDEDNRCRVGDMVKILEVRPLSKEKRWIVLDVLNRAARGE
jgi:small subunit ribosomal protein S17